jgi:hypothetical protein
MPTLTPGCISLGLTFSVSFLSYMCAVVTLVKQLRSMYYLRSCIHSPQAFSTAQEFHRLQQWVASESERRSEASQPWCTRINIRRTRAHAEESRNHSSQISECCSVSSRPFLEKTSLSFLQACQKHSVSARGAKHRSLS